MSIIVDPNDTSYDLGQLRFKDEAIISEDFDYSVEGGGDVKTVTNSKDPIRYAGSKNEYSWSANGIPPEYHDFLLKMKLNGELFPIGVFNIADDGNYRQKCTLLNAKIESVSVTQDEEGNSLEVSGNALGIKL